MIKKQKNYAKRLKKNIQRHMIGVLMQTKPRHHKSYEAYAQRRHIYTGKQI